MSLLDVLTRVEAVCKKYEKYDMEKQREKRQPGNDVFLLLYQDMLLQIGAAEERSCEAAIERNRATMAAINSEIRRRKAAIAVEIPKLERLASRKAKGVSAEELAARPNLVVALTERLNNVPDGLTNRSGATSAVKKSEAKYGFPMEGDLESRPEYWKETELSTAFRSEFKERKAKQDQNLDIISEGLNTLKNLATDMGEELDRQQPLADEIESKAVASTEEMKQTNRRLKQTLHQMRSSRMFIIDIILLCIILGLGAYLYKSLK